jgi:hypothetical protein
LGIVPFLGASFGTRIEYFQWEKLLKIQTLVWLGTKKPKNQKNQNENHKVAVQNFAGPVSRVRNWNFQKLTIPAYSP